MFPFLMILLAMMAAPFLRSVINRVKAKFAGRRGPVWLQPYYDLRKLFRKSTVYSRTTSPIFRAAPIVNVVAMIGALAIIPYPSCGAAISFSGDLFLLLSLFAVARFFMLCAAIDTGSAFGGMGASREAFFSALAEPTLLLGLGGLASVSGKTSLTEMFAIAGYGKIAGVLSPGIIFLVIALFVVQLAENCRIPFDDPTTHLELTMIHEAMILDYGGFDLGLIEYAGALKLWAFGLLIINLLIGENFILPLVLLPIFAAGIGVVESTMARASLLRLPVLFAVATVVNLLWIMWTVIGALTESAAT